MQPSFRDENFVPESFSPPSAPFDLATRTLNQRNHDAAASEPAWQNWASLLGTGYLSFVFLFLLLLLPLLSFATQMLTRFLPFYSNFGAGDPLSLQEGEGMGSFGGGSQAWNQPFPNQSMGGPSGLGSSGGLGFADISGGADGGGHRAEEGVGGRDGRGRAQEF